LELPRTGDARPWRSRRARPRADPLRGTAGLARLRGRRRGHGHVELEAGQDGARGAVGPRDARRRRPSVVPAPLRPCGTRDPQRLPRRAGPRRGRDAAHARAPRHSRAGRADRAGDPRALAAQGRPRAAPPPRPRARRRRARRSTSTPAQSSTATRRHPSSSARSTTCSGTAHWSSGSSASAT
jgi:hypothetical protein